jgi:hypothetical protein
MKPTTARLVAKSATMRSISATMSGRGSVSIERSRTAYADTASGSPSKRGITLAAAMAELGEDLPAVGVDWQSRLIGCGPAIPADEDVAGDDERRPASTIGS